MSLLSLFFYEGRHFLRSPFKYIALILFVAAAVYGIHNGAALYAEQAQEIGKITEQTKTQQAEWVSLYEKGTKGPEQRPWVDITTPFWAMWNTGTYYYKYPSPLMVYGVGQTEQYGYYKRVSFRSTPYDADMVEELGNPERQQLGTLDFTFVMLFLTPILLLLLLYNIKGIELDLGIYSLVQLQNPNSTAWLISRATYYFCMVWLVMLGLMLYASFLTPVFEASSIKFWILVFWLSMYLLFWTFLFCYVLATGTSSVSNALKMIGLWLGFTLIIPSFVHQWVSIKHPANLMTDFIDTQRDQKDALYSLPDNEIADKLFNKYPELLNSKVYKDSTLSTAAAVNESISALTNDLHKTGITKIERSYKDKNQTIKSTFWFNPVTLFQNKINSITSTDFQAYQDYRDQIQGLIDIQIDLMVNDIWQNTTITKEDYLKYINVLNDY